MFTVIIENEGNTLVMEFPCKRYLMADHLGSIGIRKPAHEIKCVDEEDEPIKVKIFGNSEFEKKLASLISSTDTLSLINTTCEIYQNMPYQNKLDAMEAVMFGKVSSVAGFDKHILETRMQDTTEYLYCPLVANVYSRDEYGNMEDYPDEYDGSYLAPYEERIRELIRLEDARDEDNLAAYFDGSNGAVGKLKEVHFSTQNVDGVLYGCIRAELTAPFTAEEEAEFKDWLEGQCSDGYLAVYDLYGNLLSETDGTTGNTTIYYADEYGSYTYVFEFDSEGDLVDTAITDKSDSITETHDAFDRITSTSLAVSDTVNIIKNFTYITDENKNSSYQINSETFSNGTTEPNITYNYEYDALGNLTKVKESGIIKIQYTYDSLSQLIREDNAYADHSYTYEYDGNGNITSKKTYAYTTGTLGSVEDTVTYSYGNSDWKDLLTLYDGTAISYDASGNPLNWTDERTITWVGRQLDSIMSPDGALWKFKYDHNGLRTEREYSYSGEIVLKTEYTWVDEKLVKEYRSGGMNTTPITLEYFYNGEDLIGFSI